MDLAALLIIAGSVIGIIVLTLSIRGRPILASPRCASCGYDLRALDFMAGSIGVCPECGAALDGPGQVSFGQYRRQRKGIYIGIALLTLPWLTVPIFMMIQRPAVRPAPPRAIRLPDRSTSALLSSIASNANSGRDWQELTQRLKNGVLTKTEVEDVFRTLVKHHTGAGAGSPIPFTFDFISVARQRKLVSDEVYNSYVAAAVGPGPTIKLRKLSEYQEPLEIGFEPVRSRVISNMGLIWSLREIRTKDGKTIDLSRAVTRYETQPHPHVLSGYEQMLTALRIPHGLEVGEHELTLTFDVGAAPIGTIFRGLNGRPGPPEQWPAGVIPWQHTITRTVQIVPANDPVVTLVTDETRNPHRQLKLSVEQLLARPTTDGVEIVIRWTMSGVVTLSVGYDATIQLDQEKLDLGTLLLPAGSRIGSHTGNRRLRSLPPTPQTVDIILTPNAIASEYMEGVDEIWGATFVVKGVTFERYDR